MMSFAIREYVCVLAGWQHNGQNGKAILQSSCAKMEEENIDSMWQPMKKKKTKKKRFHHLTLLDI